jgi:small multidrug resistance family-3 protein
MRLSIDVADVMIVLPWLVFVAAACLEMTGDAVVRRGLRGGGWPWVLGGCSILAAYGLLVNIVRWDFSRLIGVYVAFFALVSVLCGRFVLHENVPTSTWVGLAVIIAGGMIIQFGGK